MTPKSGPPHNKINLKWLESFFPMEKIWTFGFLNAFLLGRTVVNTIFDGPSMVPGDNRNLIPETKSKLVEKGSCRDSFYVQRKNKTRQ